MENVDPRLLQLITTSNNNNASKNTTTVNSYCGSDAHKLRPDNLVPDCKEIRTAGTEAVSDLSSDHNIANQTSSSGPMESVDKKPQSNSPNQKSEKKLPPPAKKKSPPKPPRLLSEDDKPKVLPAELSSNQRQSTELNDNHNCTRPTGIRSDSVDTAKNFTTENPPFPAEDLDPPGLSAVEPYSIVDTSAFQTLPTKQKKGSIESKPPLPKTKPPDASSGESQPYR